LFAAASESDLRAAAADPVSPPEPLDVAAAVAGALVAAVVAAFVGSPVVVAAAPALVAVAVLSSSPHAENATAQSASAASPRIPYVRIQPSEVPN
jgi:hypothetical protein